MWLVFYFANIDIFAANSICLDAFFLCPMGGNEPSVVWYCPEMAKKTYEITSIAFSIAHSMIFNV